MTELSGTLEGIGLAPLVSFLAGLGKSGRLTITDGPMGGEVFLDSGQLVGAAFDAERGLPALEAIGLALSSGRFGFVEQDTRLVEHNLTLTPAELRQHLEERDHARPAAPARRYQPEYAPGRGGAAAGRAPDPEEPRRRHLGALAARLLLG